MKKKIISEIDELNLKIQELTSERDMKLKEIEHISDEEDLKFLLKNWKELIHIEDKFHPNMFKHIVVSCFPLYTTRCCGMGYSKNFIYLADLLKLWNNEFVYNNNPIVDVYVGNGDKVVVKTINDGVIKTDCIIYNEAKKIIDIIKNVPSSKHYSKTSVSDIKLKTLI